MTIKPGVLRVGVWDKYFRFNQHSLTRLRECQPSFEWVDNCDDPAQVDVVMATQNSGGVLLGSKHPRKVLYLQETSEFHGNRQVYLYQQFDLVLSNDRELVEHPDLAGKVEYMTLFGTWIEEAPPVNKTKLCSLLASPNNFLSGHRVRHNVIAANVPGVDCFGGAVGRPLAPERTRDAYDAYRFNLAIENSNYPWWHTEKLFNCFAARTVPIYWGCADPTRLVEWGFDPSGMIPWNGDPTVLGNVLPSLNYDPFAAAVEHNYARTHELYCHEIVLEQVLRRRFCL